MANKRDQSNQKRQRANRAQREALAVRKVAASTPRPSRQPPVAARRTGGEVKAPAGRTEDANTGAKSGGRARRPRPPRPGDTPVDIDTLEGSFYSKVVQVPGGSQAALGFFMAVLAVGFSVVLALFVHSVPPKGTKANARNVPGVDTAIHRFGPVVLLPLVAILLAASLGYAYSLHRQRRRAWLMVAVITGVFVFVGQILFIFVAGMFAYALMRASKVEGPGESMFASLRRPRAGRSEAIDANGNEVTDS